MKKGFQLPLVDLFGLLMSAAILLSRDSLLGDPGVGWHLRAGEWIATHGAVPFVDPFLDGALPWVHDQWLSDLLLWLLYSAGGFPALHALVVIVTLSVFVLVLSPLARRTDASAVAVFLLLLLVSLLASVQWFLRPVIFSFLLFAIAYRAGFAAIERGGWSRSAFAIVPLFFALWANLHGGFWLGLLVLGVTALELLREKKIGAASAAAIVLAGLAGTLLNPWGTELWRSTLALGTDPYFTRLNREWLSPDLFDAGFVPFTLVLILLVTALARGHAGALTLFDWLLLLPLLALSLLHRRYLPFASVVLFLPLLRLYPLSPLGRFPARATGLPVLTSIFWIFLAISPLTLGRIPFFEKHTSGFPAGTPDAALALVEQSPGRLFHSPDLGGYITWKSWPRIRAHIDDRNQLLGRRPYEEFLSAVRVAPEWQAILARSEFEWAILGADYPLALVLARRGDWETVALPAGSPWQLFRRRH